MTESTPAALRGAWPQTLRACLADDARFRANPDVGSAPDVEWERRRRESQLLYRMFGLVAHAASPDSIDLSDHGELAEAIVRLCAQQQEAVTRRR